MRRDNYALLSVHCICLVDVLDASTIAVEEVISDGAESDVYAYNVTCLKLGATSFTFTVGNAKSATNP